MKYLDYTRACDADPALRNFLMSLSREDTIRRAKVAFPEFFSDKEPYVPIHLSDIRCRKALLEADIDHNELDGDDLLFPVLFGWFGLEFFEFECRAKQVDDANYQQLPSDFKLEHDECYDPLSASFEGDFWIVQLPKITGGQPVEHLVIKVQVVEPPFDTETKYFVTTLLWSDVFY